MKKIFIILGLLFVNSIIFAFDNIEVKKQAKTSTYNEVDDKYKAQEGFAFYKDSNFSKKNYRPNCSCREILKQLKIIAKEAQEQTKIQRQILKILQKTLDPQPQYITVNGKKCIANSSAECFKFPITPAAQRIPVLKAWLENPTMENTAKYLKWQAKYFKELFKRADSFPMTLAQYGPQAYPMSTLRPGYNSLIGDETKKAAVKRLINSISKDYKIAIFLGMNKDLDVILRLLEIPCQSR